MFFNVIEYLKNSYQWLHLHNREWCSNFYWFRVPCVIAWNGQQHCVVLHKISVQGMKSVVGYSDQQEMEQLNRVFLLSILWNNSTEQIRLTRCYTSIFTYYIILCSSPMNIAVLGKLFSMISYVISLSQNVILSMIWMSVSHYVFNYIYFIRALLPLLHFK